MWVKLVLFGRSSKGAMGVFSTLVFLLVGLHSGPISQAGPISPDALSGLQAWYRVDQGITLSGTQVSGWQDSSGLGRNMTQGTSGNQPTRIWNTSYAFPVVHFDGSNDYLDAGDVEVHSNSTGLTVMAVVRPSAVTSGSGSSGLILSKFAASPGNRAWRLGIDWFDVQQSPGDSWNAATELVFPDSADPIAGQWNIVTGSWFPGEAATGYLVPMSGPNAFQEICAGAATHAVTQIVDSTTATLKMGTDTGASNPWLSGDLVEVIVYNRALTESERQGVAQYLQQKYAPQTVQTGPLLVNVNFEGTVAQAHNQPLPPGYRIDNGAPSTYHGDGIWSGWRLNDGTPINVSSVGRNRNATTSPDERFDTLIHLYNTGGTPYVPYTWQLSVPNGTYWVRAVFGDSTGGTSTNNIFIQNTLFTDPDPGIGNDWDEYFGQFTVTDGKLTIAPQPEAGAKICFAQVASVFQPQIAINFEGVGTNASNAPLPNYYLKDSGAAFGDQGNGYRYGWVDPATGDPLANPNGRNRDSAASPDERYDTINHLWNGGTQHYNWEIELPNANYFVLAMFGEPSPDSAANDNVWIENVRFYDPDPSKGGDWDLFMGVVTVSDGRLTLRDIGMELGQGAKIAFLEITLVPEPSTWVLGALSGIGLLVMGGYRRLRRTGQS